MHPAHAPRAGGVGEPSGVRRYECAGRWLPAGRRGGGGIDRVWRGGGGGGGGAPPHERPPVI
eukprot:scaffold2718_cov103-Isochrysis_galbana.AAC.8